MERRIPTVAGNIADAMDAQHVTVPSVAEATHIPVSDLEARLSGEVEFKFSEVVSVGGFLRLSPATFFEGAAA